MLTADQWKDYELIDAGEEEKLERWGKYILRRPDPQAIWRRNPGLKKIWENPDMFYHRSQKGGGSWENIKRIPESWQIQYQNMKFVIKPTAFKHTGLFPEQAANWEWLMDQIDSKYIKKGETPKILNLFAYTGGATVACAFAGGMVTHIDASKGMTQIAKENMKLSGLENQGSKFIVEDVVKFVQREIKRGNKYDGIIMDPPVYGRGPEGQLWEIERDLVNLLELCSKILSDKASFFLINAYATEFSHTSIRNILQLSIQRKFGGIVSSGELGLPFSKNADLILPCGIYGRWEKEAL